MTEPVPASVGPYKILSVLGRGAMGAVYRARHPSSGKVIALKVLSSAFAADRGYRERFQREARAVSLLRHPNIVEGIDVGEVGGRPYLAMEFVEGRTALQILREDGALPEAEVIRIGRDACLALSHAARAGITHRDIKPSNLLVSAAGPVKLLDLGLAKERRLADVEASAAPEAPQGKADGLEETFVTQAGTRLGTPYYMAPEQIRAKGVDARTDLYALGATLWHLATGRPPFLGGTAPIVLAGHLHEAPRFRPEEDARLSEGFRRVLLRALKKAPAERYADPREMQEDLERVGRGEPPLGGAALPTPAAVPAEELEEGKGEAASEAEAVEEPPADAEAVPAAIPVPGRAPRRPPARARSVARRSAAAAARNSPGALRAAVSLAALAALAGGAILILRGLPAPATAPPPADAPVPKPPDKREAIVPEPPAPPLPKPGTEKEPQKEKEKPGKAEPPPAIAKKPPEPPPEDPEPEPPPEIPEPPKTPPEPPPAPEPPKPAKAKEEPKPAPEAWPALSASEREAYFRLFDPFVIAMASRDYGQARQALAPSRNAPGALGARVRHDLADLEAVEALWEQVRSGARALRGGTWQFERKSNGRVVAVKPEGVHMEIGGTAFVVLFRDMTEADILGLRARGSVSIPDAIRARGLGAWHFYEGRAARGLEAVAKLPEGPTLSREHYGEIQAEAEAASCAARIRAIVMGSRLLDVSEAREALQSLESRYARTEVFARHGRGLRDNVRSLEKQIQELKRGGRPDKRHH